MDNPKYITTDLFTDRFNSIDVTLRGIEMENDKEMNGHKVSILTISSALEAIRAYLTVLVQRGEWSENMQKSYRNMTTDLCTIIGMYCTQNSIDMESLLKQSIRRAIPSDQDKIPLDSSFAHLAIEYYSEATNTINIISQVGDPTSEIFNESMHDVPIGQLLANAVIGVMIIEEAFASEADSI